MKKWKILGKISNLKFQISNEEIIRVLLKNRGLKTKKEKENFLNTTHPEDLTLSYIGIKKANVDKAIDRIKKAIKRSEDIIIYGDYDADGVCATAILWETLYPLTKKVTPYIPNRFSEGYGLNSSVIKNLKLKIKNLKLIITVDNGIVANDAVDVANKLGVDVVITDHHQIGKKLPKADAIVHTTKIGGAGITWIFAREIAKSLKFKAKSTLELAAIGTISDQLPLIGPNRSFAKYGLDALRKTKRVGLHALFEEAGITLNGEPLQRREVGTYEVNFVVAPRLNAMGRMLHAIDSLRILCTNNVKKAQVLSNLLGNTNRERQKILEKVVLHARESAHEKKWKGLILVSHESYHEGIIGLAASKLVEEFYRPAIVISKGEKYSKGSARSIPGFNIIETIRKADDLIHGGGGHPMAAGFTIETEKLAVFAKRIEEISDPLLTNEVLTKKLSIDLKIDFNQLNHDLLEQIKVFDPTGVGNPAPTFATRKVAIVDARLVGSEGKHLKLKVEKNGIVFDAIAFGMGGLHSSLSLNKAVDLAYVFDEDTWNGNSKIQLKIKDIKI